LRAFHKLKGDFVLLTENLRDKQQDEKSDSSCISELNVAAESSVSANDHQQKPQSGVKPSQDIASVNEVSAKRDLRKTIIAVGGSKGGVGKSVISANLAVGLALLGQQVVLADLDLGGADVHLYAGVKSLKKTWKDFLEKKADSIEEILTPTAFNGLSLIGGDSSKLGSANLPYAQKQKIMKHLRELKTDYVVIDLGGDTTLNGLDFFLLADQKIVVTSTDPASVLDSYTFVKVAFHRFLERFFSEYKPLVKLAMQIKDGSLEEAKNYSLDFIFEQVRIRDESACVKLKEEFKTFNVSLVANMADHRNDVRIAQSMRQLLKQKCFLDVGILGTIPFDKAARKAARSCTPIVVENPRCQASKVIHQMLAGILLQHERESIREELLQKAGRIRNYAKNQIAAETMTMDGLTVAQISSVYGRAPRFREGFRRILDIMKS
jgi:flagellar biosynthesis protein FlhG